MASKIKSAESLEKIANEYIKPWYKRFEMWVGIIANVIALGALIVAIVALQK